MESLKVKGIFTLLFALTIYLTLAFGNVFAATTENVPVYVTVKTSSGTELKAITTYDNIKAGDKIYIEAYCNHEKSLYWAENSYFMTTAGFKVNDKGMAILAYKFDNAPTSEAVISDDPTQIVVTIPDFAPGTTHILHVQAVGAVDKLEEDGKYYVATSGWKDIKFTIPKEIVEPTPTPDPLPEEEEKLCGDITVRLNGKTLPNNSKTIIKDDEMLNVIGFPASNFASLNYKWDDEEYNKISGNVGAIEVLAKPGEVHILKIYGLLKDGGKTASKTYYFITEEPDELIIEPWMREDDNAKGLLVSLRNDSKVEKANKNFYALDEEIIYYVDYKNCGKEITNEVKLTLKLPLKFEVIDSHAGIVSNFDKTITWTFENGLEEEQAGTKEVVLKYKKLSKNSYDYEIVYPQANIYKNSKKVDSSASMNFIYLNDSTIIEEKHEPYMYGDKEKPTFRPDDTISRAEGALVLTRIFGINTENTIITDRFSDINETFPEAQRAIIAAADLGIINGYEDGTYRPKDKMTRAEFMKIIASYIEIFGNDENIDGLGVKEGYNIKVYKNPFYKEHWAIDYVTLLTRLNMTPVSEHNKDLRLNDEITRAEVAQLINFYAFRAPAKITSSTKTQFSDVSKNHELYGDIVEATRDAHSYVITEVGTEIAK